MAAFSSPAAAATTSPRLSGPRGRGSFVAGNGQATFGEVVASFRKSGTFSSKRHAKLFVSQQNHVPNSVATMYDKTINLRESERDVMKTLSYSRVSATPKSRSPSPWALRRPRSLPATPRSVSSSSWLRPGEPRFREWPLEYDERFGDAIAESPRQYSKGGGYPNNASLGYSAATTAATSGVASTATIGDGQVANSHDIGSSGSFIAGSMYKDAAEQRNSPKSPSRSLGRPQPREVLREPCAASGPFARMPPSLAGPGGAAVASTGPGRKKFCDGGGGGPGGFAAACREQPTPARARSRTAATPAAVCEPQQQQSQSGGDPRMASFVRLNGFLWRTHMTSLISALSEDGWLEAWEKEALCRHVREDAQLWAQNFLRVYNRFMETDDVHAFVAGLRSQLP